MYKKILIVSAILLALGIFVGFIGFPKLFRKMIKSQINLKPGSETRKMWEKSPIALNFAVYVFNVTNPEETQAGGKPKLQEVGPFMFEEWKDKYDVEDVEEEDAITFNMRNTFIFRPDLGLSGEELIVMPHPLIQITAISIKRDKAVMLNMIAEGLDVIFKPSHPFVIAPFMDIFFRGIDVDCSNDHFAANAICLNFHTGNVKGATKVDEKHFKFALMAGGNHSDAGRFKVARGVNMKHHVGDVLEYDGETELSNWPDDECNRIRGTDSTIFPPLLNPEEGLWAYSADLCRSMLSKFQKKVKYNGLPANRFSMDFGDVRNEPENRCFCKDYPNDCPSKGTMDLSLCNETPMIASLPHFYNGDPKLVTDVDGLHPNEEKHAIRIDFESISGTPLSAAKRLQFSLDVEPIEAIPAMKDLLRLVMPLFWVEEAIDLGPEFTDMLHKKVFLIIRINNFFKWLATVIGACGCAFSIFMLFFYKAKSVSPNANAQAITTEPKY